MFLSFRTTILLFEWFCFYISFNKLNLVGEKKIFIYMYIVLQLFTFSFILTLLFYYLSHYLSTASK